VHAIVSIPGLPEDIFLRRSAAQEIAKRHGIVGGLMVPHAWRVDDWRDWWSDEDLVPDGYIHYHIVGALGNGRFVPSKEGQGYVFKVIKRKGTYYVYNSGIKRIIRYCLSHATISRAKHALTWWGSWWRREDGAREPDLGGATASRVFECPSCGSHDVAVGPPALPHHRTVAQAVFDEQMTRWRVEPTKMSRDRAKTTRETHRKRRDTEC
jgi:hypothetical protein